jgi:hypothetical protein
VLPGGALAGRRQTAAACPHRSSWPGRSSSGSSTSGLPRARVLDFAAWPERLESARAGLLLAYLRLVNQPPDYSPPAPAAEAWQRAEDWLARPAAWIPAPGSRHRQLLGEIIRGIEPTGN